MRPVLAAARLRCRPLRGWGWHAQTRPQRRTVEARCLRAASQDAHPGKPSDRSVARLELVEVALEEQMLTDAVEVGDRGHNGGLVGCGQVVDHRVKVRRTDDAQGHGVVILSEGDGTHYDPPSGVGTAGAVRDVADARRTALSIW